MTRPVQPTPATPAGRPALKSCWMRFADLDARRLYSILRLRVDVFVVEQACPYPEIDGRDPDAHHLLFEERDSGRLAAYLRLFGPESPPAGDGFCHMGRIVTAADWRGAGLGGTLLETGLAECTRLWPGIGIRLAAQAHLRDFYGRFGFAAIGNIYDEDGIPHIDMQRPSPALSARVQEPNPS